MTDHNTPTEHDAETEATRTALCCLLSVIFPPLGAFLKVGFGGHLWLNILLTIFGYLPGICHALWVVLREDEEQEKEETA